MTSIRKAVIPAAGWGTRFLPVTKSTPKEMLPLIDRPVIEFGVEEAVAAGLNQIALVTSANKRALEDYFDRNFDLEHFLAAKNDKQRLQQVQALANLATITTVRQKQPLGLGHAILTAKPLVGREPFAVILPDDVIVAATPAIKQLVDVYERFHCSVVAVQEVAPEDVVRYGIIDAEEVEPRVYRVRRMVEKPRKEEAPSRLAVIGRYVLTYEVLDALEHVRPGAIGEIQLTDGIDDVAQGRGVYAYRFEGKLLDAGTPLGLLKSSIEMALSRAELREDFGRWLRDLVRRNGLI